MAHHLVGIAMPLPYTAAHTDHHFNYQTFFHHIKIFNTMKQCSIFLLTLIALFISLHAANAQTPAKNKEIARKILAAVDTGDFNTFALYVSPSLVEHIPLPPGTPPASSDFELARILINAFHIGFPDAKSEIQHIVAEGDMVMVHSVYTATNTGEFMGMPATNKKVRMAQVDIMRFDAAGKGVEHWAVMDQLTMLQQLGALPGN